MEELASSTRIVGDNSKKVYEVTEQTVKEAKNTEGILRDTTNSINQISESSKKIVDIVAIINDIS
jgi:methyl-accepting chemotaxis protein